MDGINLSAAGGAPTGGNADPGNTGGSPGGGGNPGGSGGSPAGGGGSDFWTGISQENRQFAESKGVKSAADLDKLIGSHRELERTFSARQPNNGGSKNTYRLGDYEFKVPDNAKEFGYDDKFASGFKQWAQANGLDPAVASSLHDFYTEHASKTYGLSAQAQAEALNQSVSKARESLVSAWGDEKSPQFARNVELAKRAINNIDPELSSALRETGVLKEVDGKLFVGNATVFKALAKIGAELYKEDSVYNTAPIKTNPFDPKSQNMTLASQIVKNDPERAISLIEALTDPQAKQIWEPQINAIRARVKK